MKTISAVFTLLLVTSCAIQSATFVLREPGDSNNASGLNSSHNLTIDENRMLIYNGEEKFFVPEGKQVEVRVAAGQNTEFFLVERYFFRLKISNS